MSFPKHPFCFGSGNLDDAKRDLDRAKQTVDGAQAQVGSFLQQCAERELSEARRQVAEFLEVQTAIDKSRAIQARADQYAREMRPHGFVWDMERKIGRYLTTTEHKLIGFQAGMIVGAVLGVGAAIACLILLVQNGGVRP